MVLHFASLVGLVSAASPTGLPPRPDFVAMVPQASSIFFGPVQDRCDPARREAVVLAQYLNRFWVSAILGDPYDYSVNLLTLIQQFDSALLGVNPNPTVGEAIARVRVYNAVLALCRREIKRDDMHPRQRPPGQLCQLRAGSVRLNRIIQKVYYPLFVRTPIREVPTPARFEEVDRFEQRLAKTWHRDRCVPLSVNSSHRSLVHITSGEIPLRAQKARN